MNIEGTWKITAAQDSFKPESGSVPFTGKGRKRYQDNKRNLAKRNYDDFDYMTARCASPGLPRLMLTPDRFRIWQRSGLTVFQFEWNRLSRQIDMGGLMPQFNMGERTLVMMRRSVARSPFPGDAGRATRSW